MQTIYKDTEEQLKSFNVLFNEIYKGDKLAIDLSFKLLQIVHVWDDLIDKDKELSKADINSAFLNAVVGLTLCPLWDNALASLFISVFLRWEAANNIENTQKDDKNEIAKAWILRMGIYDMFPAIATKLYGIDFGIAASKATYAFYGEKLDDFTKEVQDA